MKKQFAIIAIIIIAIILFLSGCHKVATLDEEQLRPAIARNEIAGIITSDTTLSGNVLVSSDVYVPRGVTLTIMPGTIVTIVKSESTKVAPLFLSSETELLIKGRIIAKGTKDNPIIFASDQLKPEMKEYAGIILFDSDEAVFENCAFHNAYAAITAVRSKINLTLCEFTNCFYALSIINSKVAIEANTVKDCDKGFYFHRGTTGTIARSKFTNCLEEAIFIDKTSSLKVTGNIFISNLWGISSIQYEGDFKKDNVFKNNKEDVRQLNY